MSNLFNIENNRCKPIIETLLITPFKEIWEQDTSEDKGEAIKQFTFIELYSSLKLSNPYAGYSNEKRLQVLGKELFGIENATLVESLPNGYMLQEGINKMNELQIEGSVTLRLYQAIKDSLEQLILDLADVSISERTDKGMAVFKPSDILGFVDKAYGAITSLEKIKDTVIKEDFSITKTRSNRAINSYEE